MDRSQLTSLKRFQLQHLAKRENLKGNLKNVEIVRLLLEKYPGGVPELTENPSASRRPISSPTKTKRAAGGKKRKSAAKSEPLPIKAEPTLDGPSSPRKGRDARSMAPPPITPTASLNDLRLLMLSRLPPTPPIDAIFETQTEAEDDEVPGVHGALRLHETGSTLSEATPATSHQVREMLRNLTDIIDTTSLDPEEPSSILYRARALNTILDTIIVPRAMKMDKDIKDITWMRVAVENRLGPQLKEDGVLPGSERSGIPNVGSRFPTPQPPSLKRPREERDGEGISPPAHPSASKRSRLR